MALGMEPGLRHTQTELTQRRKGNIPKGLCHSAERCRDEGEATLGGESQIEINPNGVVSRTQQANPPPRWG
jgi:hypothetical protein